MHKKFYTFIWILLIVFPSKPSAKIYSFLEKSYIDGEISIEAREDLENIFLNYYGIINNEEDDLFCAMNDEKKNALCNLVQQTDQFKSMAFYVNKVAHYMIKLHCQYKEIKFQFMKNEMMDQVIRKIYPCYGRHKIVRTSFIEDDFYSFIFLSIGPFVNSVSVYVQPSLITSDIYIYDFIYNVDLSELQNTSVRVKEVTKELNLNKSVFSIGNYEEVLLLYGNYLSDYKENEDPVCDLKYEKKVTLCSIIFNYLESANLMDVKLNKSASYALSMDCITKPVKKSVSDFQILRAKQKLYPCYGKDANSEESTSGSENLLNTDLINKFYISYGFKRNTVILYVRMRAVNTDDIFVLLDIIGNINLQLLKPTFIKLSELYAESTSTVSHIETLIHNAEILIGSEWLRSFASCKSLSEENEKIKLLMKETEKKILKAAKNEDVKVEVTFEEATNDYDAIKKTFSHETIENTQDSVSSVEHVTKEYDTSQIQISNETQESKKTFKQIMNLSQIMDYVQIGPQIYKKILLKKKLEQESEKTAWLTGGSPTLIAEKMRKKLSQKWDMKKMDIAEESRNMKDKVQKLIEKMENNFVKQKMKDESTKDNKEEAKTSKRKSKKKKHK